MDKNYLDLKSALSRSKKAFYFTGFVSLFINLLMLVPPLYMLQLYDRVLLSRSEETLIMLTVIVVILFVIMGLLEFVRSRILIRVSNAIDERLRTQVFDVMFKMANKYPSNASSQPISDMTQIRQFLSGSPLFAFFDAPWIPIYITILFLFHPWFGWFGIASVIIVLALTFLNETKTKKGIEESNKTFQDSQSFVTSSLRNTEVIEAMGMHQNIKKIWEKTYLKYLLLQSNTSDESSIWANLSKYVRLLLQSLILGLGGYLAIISEVTPGMMIAGSIILGRALAPLDLMTSTWKQFVSARLGYTRLNTILEDFPIKKRETSLPNPMGDISIESLSLIPPGGENATLSNISLEIEKGDIVGVIGHSAAGKSSLIRAMIGIWPANYGTVRLDGAEIDNYDRDDLGRSIGYLPQNIELFGGTVSENIARFEQPDSDKVIQAAKLCGLHEMILQLPNGYDTQIGVGGTALSGGQKQRIALARAVYTEPRIVVLDEPNSNLDEIGEQALLNTILLLKQNSVTVILVTHRANILSICNKVLLLDSGQVQLYGPKDEVLKAISGDK